MRSAWSDGAGIFPAPEARQALSAPGRTVGLPGKPCASSAVGPSSSATDHRHLRGMGRQCGAIRVQRMAQTALATSGRPRAPGVVGAVAAAYVARSAAPPVPSPRQPVSFLAGLRGALRVE